MNRLLPYLLFNFLTSSIYFHDFAKLLISKKYMKRISCVKKN